MKRRILNELKKIAIAYGMVIGITVLSFSSPMW